MLKEKNNLIVELLFKSTETNNLLWTETSVNDNRRNYLRMMQATGEDGTKYEIEVKYSLVGDVFKLETTPSLWLRHSNLPNGMYMISTFNTDDDLLVNLRNIIKDKFCADLNPTSQLIEDTLDTISKGISISEYRENKLNKIL